MDSKLPAIRAGARDVGNADDAAKPDRIERDPTFGRVADAGASEASRLRSASRPPVESSAPDIRRIIVRRLGLPKRGDAHETWEARLEDGRVLVARSHTPFFDGARAMLAAGFDPEALVTMRHVGGSCDSFWPVKLVIAAGLTVTEPAAQSARIRPTAASAMFGVTRNRPPVQVRPGWMPRRTEASREAFRTGRRRRPSPTTLPARCLTMGVFANWQPRYAEHSIPTFPTLDKMPAIRGWQRVGAKGSRQLVLRFPEANELAFQPEPRSGLTVIDVDTTDEAVWRDAVKRFGDTLIMVRTGSGHLHLWYAHNGEPRKIRAEGCIDPHPTVGFTLGG